MGAQAGTSPAAASKEVKGTKKEEFYNFKHAHTDTHTHKLLHFQFQKKEKSVLHTTMAELLLPFGLLNALTVS